MEKGARILAEVCAGVQEGEDVLIVTDEERLPIARAVEAASYAAGGCTSLILCPPRGIDNEEPAAPVAAAMRAAHVVIMPVTHVRAEPRSRAQLRAVVLVADAPGSRRRSPRALSGPRP